MVIQKSLTQKSAKKSVKCHPLIVLKGGEVFLPCSRTRLRLGGRAVIDGGEKSRSVEAALHATAHDRLVVLATSKSGMKDNDIYLTATLGAIEKIETSPPNPFLGATAVIDIVGVVRVDIKQLLENNDFSMVEYVEVPDKTEILDTELFACAHATLREVVATLNFLSLKKLKESLGLQSLYARIDATNNLDSFSRVLFELLPPISHHLRRVHALRSPNKRLQYLIDYMRDQLARGD